MIQQVPIRGYRLKPMSPETRVKVDRSRAEVLDLTERELHCPQCGRYIATLYSDSSGHFKQKCPNCKVETIYNLGYFRRRHSRRAGRKTKY